MTDAQMTSSSVYGGGGEGSAPCSRMYDPPALCGDRKAWLAELTGEQWIQVKQSISWDNHMHDIDH